MTVSACSPLEARLSGSLTTRLLLELFGNSAHFPIANVLLELLVAKGAGSYLLEPDPYVIVAASIAQAYALTRWQGSGRPRRFVGNLIGPCLYTLVESLMEGAAFFAAPHHLAYWLFSMAIGGLQAVQPRVPAPAAALLVVAENVVRGSILFLMYVLFELRTDPSPLSWHGYFADGSHVFIALAVLLMGLSGGLANLTSERSLKLVRQTTAQLKVYSEWLLGHDRLQQSFIDPAALALKRRERTVLFMDVRGFTRWSEAQAPEAVVELLDCYYQAAESVLARHETVKSKFSADEVMAVFATAQSALAAAIELRAATLPLMSAFGLGSGIGIHRGPVVEGLLGSTGARFFDVIGDTVNTAKRIEGAAGAGEILVSQACREALGQSLDAGARREISVKGKEAPVAVYRVERLRGKNKVEDPEIAATNCPGEPP